MVESPCRSECMLNVEGLCIGCFRTAEEIERWIQLTDDEKQRVVVRSQERRSQYSKLSNQ